MGIVEKSGFWRNVGRLVNTGVGSKVMAGAGTMVNRVAGLSTPNLRSDIPWTNAKKPLQECNVALINTAGIYLDGDTPFDVDKGIGDTSFREMPSDFAVDALRIAHAHYPHRYVKEDINVLLPIDHLRNLEAAGIFKLSPRFFAFGFGGNQTGAYVKGPDGSAHQVARKLKEDGADIVILAPA